MTKKIKSLRDNWKNAFIIFTIAWFLSYQVSSYGGEWEQEIKESTAYKIQLVEEAPFNKYFFYNSVVFEKTWSGSAVFSGDETISYISTRAIYDIIKSLNFSEKIWRIEEWGIIRNVSNLWTPKNDNAIIDDNNYKTPHEKKDFYWDLSYNSGIPVTCLTLWVWSYKVQHNITAIVEYGIPKPQTPALYTYFDCVWEEL